MLLFWYYSRLSQMSKHFSLKYASCRWPIAGWKSTWKLHELFLRFYFFVKLTTPLIPASIILWQWLLVSFTRSLPSRKWRSSFHFRITFWTIFHSRIIELHRVVLVHIYFLFLILSEIFPSNSAPKPMIVPNTAPFPIIYQSESENNATTKPMMIPVVSPLQTAFRVLK